MARNIKTLYSVVVGLSLLQAVSNVIDVTRGAVPIKLELVPFFIAFLVTLLPFYHAALRHLEAAYEGQAGKRIRGGALLADHAFLVMEVCLFVALGVLIVTPEFFAWCLPVLFGLNAIRAVAAYLAFPREARPRAELLWAFINLGTAELLIIYFTWVGPLPPTAGPSEPSLAAVILATTLGRTVTDYASCWTFYYPEV